MNPVNLYMLPGKIGLKFNDSAARDSFWSAMSDAGRAASERIANRTIRFYPDRVTDSQGMVIPLSGNGTAPVAVPVVAKPHPAQAQPGIVNLAAGGDPFAPSGHAVKALPGMVAVASNLPPGMAQERSEAVQPHPEPQNAPQSQPSAEAVAPIAPEPKPEPPKNDPEPKDRRTKAWREWKLRQIDNEKAPKP